MDVERRLNARLGTAGDAGVRAGRRRLAVARPRLDRRGFTLVELFMGLALFAIILTGLASSAIYSSKIRTNSQARLGAAHFMQVELEYLLSRPYDSLTSGSRSSELGDSQWVVEDSFAYTKILLNITYAPTEGVSVEDSIVAYRKSP